jgi:hypothetical protein
MEILISLFIGIFLMELYAWLDPLAKWLVERVAKELPEDRQAEFTEQFMADLATLPNSVAKVYFAFRDCTMAAETIYQSVYRDAFLFMADDLDSAIEKLCHADQRVETAKAQLQLNFRSSTAFISTVDRSLATLRGYQRQDDREAQIAIDRFQAISSPVVGVLSAIHAKFEQRHHRLHDFVGRLRDPVAKAIEASEKIRRRVLDEKPLDDDDGLLVDLFLERIEQVAAVCSEHNADEGLPDDLSDVPAIPDDLGVQLKTIVEAFRAAAQVVKRSN